MNTIRLPGGVYYYDPAHPLGIRGGFGQVFLGSTVDGTEIAVKKLHLSAAEAGHRELMVVEELKARTLQHVIGFIDAGEDADTDNYFIVMPKADYSPMPSRESAVQKF